VILGSRPPGRWGADVRGDTVQLKLLGRFTMAVGGCPLVVSRTGQRLLARVALNDGAEDRAVLARSLWPRHPHARAQANLRGAVWRLPPELHERLVLDAGVLAFGDHWDIDLDIVERVVGGRPCGDLPPASLFRYDLLPDWDEPWLLVHRERYRQLRLHGLEDLARRHLDAGEPFQAIDCALLAICSEPLRESAQRLLVRSHLAAGNRAAAWSCYERFRRLLVEELGVPPGPDFTSLVAGLRGSS
jgi:DNA-binding SARP family transcriptional activator